MNELTWTGATDFSRTRGTDYFIPRSLQSDFMRVHAALSPFITPERHARLRNIVSKRARRVAAVFESTHHSHNISAVLRTMDAFGFQDAFFVYSPDLMRFRFKDSVERGSSNWLSSRRAPDIATCARALKASGYKIALVSLPGFCRTSDHFDANLPSFGVQEFGSDLFMRALSDARLALVFGNEMHGVGEPWVEHADMYVHVDMFGFVESLNVSVCAGILLQRLREKLCAPVGDASLAEHERALLLEHWVARSCVNGLDILRASHPDWVAYFDFVRAGGFYAPF